MFPEMNLGIFYAFSGGMPISRVSGERTYLFTFILPFSEPTLFVNSSSLSQFNFSEIYFITTLFQSKNMFDVLDPVIVETIVNGFFDPEKYEMINNLMEKWGKSVFFPDKGPEGNIYLL